VARPPPNPINIVEPRPWHSWWAAFKTAHTSAEALAIFVEHGVDILQRGASLVAAMRSLQHHRRWPHHDHQRGT
jgi:hypothetical protein